MGTRFASCALLTVFCVSQLAIVVASAATNYIPSEQAEGMKAVSISPSVKNESVEAEVITPVEEVAEKQPFEQIVPDFVDSSPFVPIESEQDFSQQYDYTNSVLTSVYGSCDVSDGVYTATTSASIYANMNSATAFPYGTISADIMNNGGDTGFVIGLSSTQSTFWEGNGTSYYFAFISFEGVLFLGKTDNGVWSTLTYTSISGFSTTTTYNLKVLYRGDRLVMFLNNVPKLTYRTLTPLTGVNWGIRTGAIGATVSNISISNKVTAE